MDFLVCLLVMIISIDTIMCGIVNGGRLVMKAGDLQRPNSLLCFLACHVILMVHTDFQDGGQSVVVLQNRPSFLAFHRKSNNSIF